jgi:hypothetical protein
VGEHEADGKADGKNDGEFIFHIRILSSVAQVSKPAVSPISKSAGRRNVERVEILTGRQVWKPAIQQTWKSALRSRSSLG